MHPNDPHGYLLLVVTLNFLVLVLGLGVLSWLKSKNDPSAWPFFRKFVLMVVVIAGVVYWMHVEYTAQLLLK